MGARLYVGTQMLRSGAATEGPQARADFPKVRSQVRPSYTPPGADLPVPSCVRIIGLQFHQFHGDGRAVRDHRRLQLARREIKGES